MLRYYQKALRELEQSASRHQAEGELEELPEGQVVCNGQSFADHQNRKENDERESHHTHGKKRNKELRREKKKKGKEKTVDDFVLKTVAHDNVDVSKVKQKKKKKKKKRKRLETDTEAVNSIKLESFKTQVEQYRVDDSSVNSSSKEIKKKRKRESQTDFSDGAINKSKHSASKSQKHRDKEKYNEMQDNNFSSNQRTENVHTSPESSTLEQETVCLEDFPRSSFKSNTHHHDSKKITLSGKEHVSTGKDQHQEKRNKRTNNLTTDTAEDKTSHVNSNNNKKDAVRARFDPTDISNIIIDEAKLREATVISNKIHESWALSKERLKELAEQGIKVKKGKWSIQEVNLLKFNMARFLKHHNLTDTNLLICRAGMGGDEIKQWRCFAKSHNFYKELGKGIHRAFNSIYHCALRLFDDRNYVGRYTKDEVKNLKRLHTIHGSKWVTIGHLMGRSGLSLARKHSTLPPTGINQYSKGKWTDDEVKRLNEAVHLVTNTADGEPVFHGIYWPGVAQIVKTRSSYSCREKWLFKLCWSNKENNTEIKWTKKDDIKLITRLYNSGVMEDCDVDWMEVKSEFDIDYSPQWLREKWGKVRRTVPNYQRSTFEDIVDYLYHVYAKTER